MKSIFKFSNISNNDHKVVLNNKYNVVPGIKVKNIKMVSKNIKMPLDGSSNNKAIDIISDDISKYLIDNKYCAVHSIFSPYNNNSRETQRVDIFVKLDSYNHIIVYCELYNESDGYIKYMVVLTNTISDAAELFYSSNNMNNASLMEYRNPDNLVLDFKCNKYRVDKIITNKLNVVDK